jgi:hypothetical protein
MALVINAPEEVYSIENFHNKKLFIAGGISNCKNWQDKLTEYLKDQPGLTIYNPRRNDFDLNNEKETEKQIVWEYEHLIKADIISFWFTSDTLCPITLYELGLHGNPEKTIIGIDPEYKRKKDIEIQSKLTRPASPIVYSLEELANEIIKKLNFFNTL